jgi:ElaB/YqjD/DUF883 family membrane-anchored ribosome-binding protein
MIASYERLLVGDKSLAHPLHMTTQEVLDNALPTQSVVNQEPSPEIRSEALEALESINSSTTEKKHTFMKKGKNTYDITEEWIGPRPTVTDAYGNPAKLDMDNNVF